MDNDAGVHCIFHEMIKSSAKLVSHDLERKATINTLIHKARNKFKSHIVRSWPPLCVIFVVTITFLSLVYSFANSKGISFGYFTRDSNEINGMPFYIGSISTLGVIMWSAAAALSLMGAILLYNKSRMFWLLLSAGMLTTLLTLDDTFQIHEKLFPKHHSVIYLIYFPFLAAFLIYFLKDILNDTEFLILGASLLCLAISIIFGTFTNNVLIKDSSKFIGIALWLTYFSLTDIHLVDRYRRPI